MSARGRELVDVLDTFGNMPTRCTLVLDAPRREIFDGQVGVTRSSGDTATVEIGDDVATIPIDEVRDFDLSDPVPGFEYRLHVYM